MKWIDRAALAGLAMLSVAAVSVQAQVAGNGASAVYRCPGNPVLYTDTLSAAEARDKGCRTLEGTPITVISSGRPRPAPAASAAPATATATAPASANARVDPADQRTRDSERRAILQGELRKEEQALAALQKEYNNGEPERRGDERNFQKYLDRVGELRASIARRDADIAALKRELAKLAP